MKAGLTITDNNKINVENYCIVILSLWHFFEFSFSSSDIMRSCWNESPRKRCSFQQIIKSLNEVMAIMTGNISPLDLEEPGCAAANAGYLIPMKAMDGGFSIEEGKSMGKNAYANVTTRK